MINFCWFIFKWGVVPGLIAVLIVIAYLDHRLGEEIRKRVEARIAEHYTNLTVTVRAASLVKGEGIEIRGVSILDPGQQGPRAELIHIEEIFLSCPTELKDLIGEKLPVAGVTVRRPTLRVTRQPDGTWSSARLLPLPKFSRRPPEITIENGTIEILDPSKDPAGMLTLRDANLSISPPDDVESCGEVCPPRALRGTLTGDHLRRVQFEGTIDPQSGRWCLGGVVEGLDISPELRRALPANLAEKLTVLSDFRGQGEFSFRIRNGGDPQTPYRFELAGRVTNGRLNDPQLPYPLTDIRASVCSSNEGFSVDELFARSGQSTLRLSCRRAGYEQNSPWVVEAEVRQLELDERLLDALPEVLKQQWRKYLPSGLVHTNVKLVSDGQGWRPEQSEVLVHCLDVSFTYHKFPYRLEHGRGTLELSGNVLRANMTAQSGTQPIRLAAEVHQPIGGPYGWFTARGENLPLDEKLMLALKEPHRRVVKSLNPQGTVDFSLRVWREKPGGPARRHLLVGLNRCAMRFEKFPYQLNNIRGTFEWFPDDSWSFRELEGTNDTGRVTCNGWLANTPEGKKLSLVLTGKDIPLEEELRDALRPSMRRLWNNVKPRGMVDLTEVGIDYLVDQKQLSLTVVAQPQSETTSIEPNAFPYRMEKLRGRLIYRDGHVVLQGLRAEHGRVRLSGQGYCDFQRDGGWHFHLGGVSVDRLKLDRQLIQALPERLRKTLTECNPSGRQIDLHRGTLDLKCDGRPGDPVRAAWNLALVFNQGAVDCGIKLTNMHGGLTIQGRSDGEHFYCRGELDIDSLNYKGLQFTQVMGPFWIDDRQVLFGSWVDHTQRSESGDDRSAGPHQPRKLTARLFGGIVEGDCWIALGGIPRYAVHAKLSRANLARFAKETMPGRNRLRGNIMAVVDLRGQGKSLNSLAGRGEIRLRDADVYELPLMIALLKILSIREPDSTAFTKSDIDFRIKGNHIYFNRIDFNGDAISLLGKGEMDFQSNVNLAFHAVVGRDEIRVPVLSPLLGGASRQTLLIKVTGTLQQPNTSRDVLPGVKQALQQLRAELQGSSAAGPPPQAVNPLRVNRQ